MIHCVAQIWTLVIPLRERKLNPITKLMNYMDLKWFLFFFFCSNNWHRIRNIEWLGRWGSRTRSCAKSAWFTRWHSCTTRWLCWRRCTSGHVVRQQTVCSFTGNENSFKWNSSKHTKMAIYWMNSINKIAWYLHFFFSFCQLYDKISCTVMSPIRAPPGDAVARCRDTIELIISAPGHKYNCEKNELLQLLSQSHVQVSGIAF